MNERERLLKLIADNNMSAKQFAAEVGIQAGTISNIVNGRNNPSLDVMQRVLNRFRTLSSDWLILGVGNMYRAEGGKENRENGKAKETGVVYEKASENAESKKATYSVHKMSAEDRAALVEQMKADQQSRQQQLANLVQEMLGKQANASNLSSLFSPDFRR